MKNSTDSERRSEVRGASRPGAGSSRRTAAFIVLKWLVTRDFPAGMLPDGPQRAFVQDLVYTVIRRVRALRFVLGRLVKRWPQGELEALLYVGAAQVLYMDDVKDYAAVSETVEAAKGCEKDSVARVVNGVLRNLLRRRTELEELLASQPADVRYSMPRELYGRWVGRYGEELAMSLAKCCNSEAVTYIARRDGSFAPLERGKRVEDVPGYVQGEFIVQDPATAKAIELLSPKPCEAVLDACAAPGGKTIQCAWRGANVTACEVNPKRRRRLVENLSRVALADSVRVIDAIPSASGDNGALFDKILVDAPCSNTGVLRRRPDARWNWSPERLAALVRLQAEILDSAARCLRPGGLLVYSTCSIEPEENGEQVNAFLKRHPDFAIVTSVECLPEINGPDGCFAAALRRSES